MIVDDAFLEALKNFPMGKSHVNYNGGTFRTYREIFKGRTSREVCIAVSLETQDIHVSFNLYHLKKTTRLKMSEGDESSAINFIKGFTKIDSESQDTKLSSVKNDKKRRFFKFL